MYMNIFWGHRGPTCLNMLSMSTYNLFQMTEYCLFTTIIFIFFYVTTKVRKPFSLFLLNIYEILRAQLAPRKTNQRLMSLAQLNLWPALAAALWQSGSKCYNHISWVQHDDKIQIKYRVLKTCTSKKKQNKKLKKIINK